LVPIRHVAEVLLRRGHQVVAAVRDVVNAQIVFRGLELRYLQAPIKLRRVPGRFSPPLTFAHILYNESLGDPGDLSARLASWHSILDRLRPDLVLMDHSPTALLATRRWPVKRVILGTGFFYPPDQYPLPNLRPWQHVDPESLRQQEDRLLASVSRLLENWGTPPLQRIAQLYHQVDDCLLITFKELDHYGPRPGMRYWGVWPSDTGLPPQWPPGDGPRIFAYLKPEANLPTLIRDLARRGQPTLIRLDGVASSIRQQFESATLSFSDQPVAMPDVAATCDLAVLNGNHATTADLLLAGKPILQVPITLEQWMFSNQTVELGAGLCVPMSTPEDIPAALDTMMQESRFAAAARRFAERYSDFDASGQVRDLVDRMERLLSD